MLRMLLMMMVMMMMILFFMLVVVVIVVLVTVIMTVMMMMMMGAFRECNHTEAGYDDCKQNQTELHCSLLVLWDIFFA